MNGTNGAGRQGCLEIPDADIELAVEESEKLREQLRVQATELGPILESLLHDAHGQIRWGLNE